MKKKPEKRCRLAKESLAGDCLVTPKIYREHALAYTQGLLSNVEKKNRKNAESIAYLHGQDRQPLQIFIGPHNWNEHALLDELAEQVAQHIGSELGILVIDPTSSPKRGMMSVGVQRQPDNTSHRISKKRNNAIKQTHPP